MNLTTADRYFALFPESKKSAQDTDIIKIEMRIASVSVNVEKYLNRAVQVLARTEKFTPDNGLGTKSVFVSAFPISSVTSVSVYGEALASDEFNYDSATGEISFAERVERIEPLFERSIAVTYTGGMALDTDSFDATYTDIEIEILNQVNFELKRIGDIAMKSVANGQTSSQLNEYGLMGSLTTVLDRYRRVTAP